MNTVEALECRERERYAVHNIQSFLFCYFCKVIHTKCIVPEVHFHVKLIGASPVVIACKMAKLFKFLHSQTQRDPTIVTWICPSPPALGPSKTIQLCHQSSHLRAVPSQGPQHQGIGLLCQQLVHPLRFPPLLN